MIVLGIATQPSAHDRLVREPNASMRTPVLNTLTDCTVAGAQSSALSAHLPKVGNANCVRVRRNLSVSSRAI